MQTHRQKESLPYTDIELTYSRYRTLTDRHSDGRTYRHSLQTDNRQQTYSHTARHTARQTDRPTYKHTDTQADIHTEKQTERHIMDIQTDTQQKYRQKYKETYQQADREDRDKHRSTDNDKQYIKKQKESDRYAVAVLGFCVWGLMGLVFLFGGLMGIKRRRRETAIAEGKKPLTTKGSGGAS